MLVVADLCLCEYTSHGHCGALRNGEVDNDETLKLLARAGLAQAEAGADIIAPSDMMDGRVRAVRESLDSNGFSHIPIMSYAAKYASALYGPFRDAAESTPQFGDRRGYQMDPPNQREALREMELDVEEGADIIMVKPALFYLDILALARQRINRPLAAYCVSGEYTMVTVRGSPGLHRLQEGGDGAVHQHQAGRRRHHHHLFRKGYCPMDERSQPLRMIAWELTRNCNLNCVHCRARASAGPHDERALPGGVQAHHRRYGRLFLAHHYSDRRRAPAQAGHLRHHRPTRPQRAADGHRGERHPRRPGGGAEAERRGASCG